MKSGILTRFLCWCGTAFVSLVAVGAVLVLVVGPRDAASLYGTGAVVGGVSTGLTFGSVGAYLSSIGDGYALVETDGADITAWKALGEESDAKKKG